MSWKWKVTTSKTYPETSTKKSGFERNQVKNGRVVQEGAFEYNQKQIKLAEKDMPGLTQKIGGNYLLGFRQS
jgi:hypothetical protein